MPRIFRIVCSPESLLVSLCFAGLLIFHGHRVNELLWTNEIITRRNLSLSWIELVQDRYWEGHSPLYFALMKLWALAVAGIKGVAPNELSAAALQLPSLAAIGVAGGLLCRQCMACLGAHMWGPARAALGPKSNDRLLFRRSAAVGLSAPRLGHRSLERSPSLIPVGTVEECR